MGKVCLVQAVLFLAAGVFFVRPLLLAGDCATAASTSNALALFVCAYGVALGAHHYAMRVHLFELVKSRDFGQSMSLVLCCQSFPVLAGVPAYHALGGANGRGSVAAGACVLIAAALLTFSYCCCCGGRSNRGGSGTAKPGMRNRKTQTAGAGCDPECTCNAFKDDENDDDDYEFDTEFDEDEDEVIKAMILALYGAGANGNVDGDALLAGGAGGIGDDITSCAQGENDLVFSEFEQNLFKEASDHAAAAAAAATAGRPNAVPAVASSADEIGEVSLVAKTSKKAKKKASSLKASSVSVSAAVSERDRKLWTLRRQSTEDISLSSSSAAATGGGGAEKYVSKYTHC